MAVGFRLSNGVDLASTFAARVSTARAAVGFRNSAGTDLASVLEPLHGSTPKVGATGLRMSNGADLNTAFDTEAGVPQNFSASPSDTAATDLTASATLTIKSDGTVGSTGDTGIKWFSNTITGIGAGYQVKFHLDSGGPLSGTFDTWQSLSTSRSITCTVTTQPGKPGAGRSATASITIRDADTLATVCTGTASFTVQSGSDMTEPP